MKILTVEEMRDVDRRTIEAGIPGLILMENAGSRVVEFLVERFSPLQAQRIVVVCGKGNNGGDGLVIARQLWTRFKPRSLDVFLAANPSEMTGDALANYRMFLAAGGKFTEKIETRHGAATLVIDALLGTGLNGAAKGEPLDWIHRMNTMFPAAKVVAVDVPSGLVAGGGKFVRADHTVTFTAPKTLMVMPPFCEALGELVVGRIGSPDYLLEPARLNLSELGDFAAMLAPRARDSHKGTYGHVLVVGGAPGKTGAAQMAGLAALRSGAGLVTVASAAEAGLVPELMSTPLNGELPVEKKTVLALGPGLGSEPAMIDLARRLAREVSVPMVIDADGLNALAGVEAPWATDGAPRILTPHPGEMSRLAGVPANASGEARVQLAREFAIQKQCAVVLKGNRTVIAFADGNVWINPTGSPALAKGGSGDVLTGLIAGLVAQFPSEWKLAVRAAVFLHGRAGELAAEVRGEKGVLATDLLDYLFAGLKSV